MEQSFGNWIKRRRKTLDLTQNDLAELVGCSPSLIVKIESDVRRPSLQIAKLLVEHLDIPNHQRDLFLKVARQEKATDGLDEPTTLSGPGQASSPNPPRQLNLPSPLTPIVGRDNELFAIAEQVHNPACRLLTITGPGGVGKTRLALEAAHQLRKAFHDGAGFVSLAGASATDFIIPAIADALEFTSSSGSELKTQLINFLKDRQILLVLDNLEHLLNGIELLDDLLASAPQLKIIATSREQLNLHTEWILEVHGLPIASAEAGGELESNSATALFIHRARQARANLNLTKTDFVAIERICRLVDGLPLAIEIAAAWVRTLTMQEVANEIEQNLDFLTTTARDIPERHRSIRAVFDYSWNLLIEKERQAMMQLSVFRGGFTREAAEQVSGATLPTLSSLLNKSLIRRSDSDRYDLHELVRQFAHNRLHEYSQENLAAHDRHCDYFIYLLQRAESPLKGAQQNQALHHLSLEVDNLRSAWDWAIAQKKLHHLRSGARCLQWFYDLRGWLREGARMLNFALKKLEMNSDPIHSPSEYSDTITTLSIYLGLADVRSGQVAQGREMLSRNLDKTRRQLDKEALADNLAFLGLADHLSGNHEEAKERLHEALSVSLSINYSWIMATTHMLLGMVFQTLGEFDEADSHLNESLKQWRAIGNPRNTGSCLIIYSSLLNTMKRYDESRQMLRESLAIGRDEKDQWIIASSMLRLSLLAYAQEESGQLNMTAGENGLVQYRELAQALVEESITLYRELGDRWSLAISLTHLGEIFAARGEVAEARKQFLEALQMTLEAQITPETLRAMLGLATLHIADGDTIRALELMNVISQSSATSQKIHQRVLTLRSELEEQLTRDQLESILLRAKTMTLESLARELIEE